MDKVLTEFVWKMIFFIGGFLLLTTTWGLELNEWMIARQRNALTVTNYIRGAASSP